MSKSEDINTLFRRFGGDANSYQEIVAGELADVAEQKWPILGQVRLQAHREAPAAHKGAVVSGGRQVDAFRSPPPFAVAQTLSTPAAPPLPSPPPEAVVVSAPAAAELPTMLAAHADISAPVANVGGLMPVAQAEERVSIDLPRVSVHGISAQSLASADLRAEADGGKPDSADLQNLFHRLVPRRVDVPVPSSAAPLKRLVKW